MSNFLDGLPFKELLEMCPNTEFFLVRIFPYSVQKGENKDQKKLRIWTLFMQLSVNVSGFSMEIIL